MQTPPPFPPVFRPAGIDLILLPTAITFAVISIVRSKKDIGGWLLYFYYWILACLFINGREALRDVGIFLSYGRANSAHDGALFAAVYPRFLGILAAVVGAFILLAKRDQVWLERLQALLLANAFISGISLGLDVQYFPGSTFSNASRWIGLCLWVLYFYFSKRVKRAFGAMDSGVAPVVERVMT